MTEVRKMNPEIKKRWVKALRSRKYKQGKNYLCQISEKGKKSFCCLGVLADIEGDGKWVLNKSETFLEFHSKDGSIHSAGLPEYLLNATNLWGVQSILMDMNDGIEKDQKKFYQIANWIEKNL